MTRPSDRAFLIEQDRDLRVAQMVNAQSELTRNRKAQLNLEARYREFESYLKIANDLVMAQTAMVRWYRNTSEQVDD